MTAVREKNVWMSCDNEKIVHLKCRFCDRHREDRFSDLLAGSAKSGKFHESGHEFQEGGSTHRAWTAFRLSSD